MRPVAPTDWETDPLKHWPHLSNTDIRETMGFIPAFLPSHDRPAAEQFDEHYSFGGWSPMSGWLMSNEGVLRYPGGDPPLYPAALLDKTDGETVRFYPGAWVSIRQANGDYEVAKID